MHLKRYTETLGTGMGLDAGELMAAIEDTFRVRITDDEACRIATAGDARDLIIAKLALRFGPNWPPAAPSTAHAADWSQYWGSSGEKSSHPRPWTKYFPEKVGAASGGASPT